MNAHFVSLSVGVVALGLGCGTMRFERLELGAVCLFLPAPRTRGELRLRVRPAAVLRR